MSAGSGNGAVTRSTLRQQIAEALRDEVLGGRLQPGQEFTVKEIAEQYGVSATPVREALVDLSAQGLLEADQHRGFRVHEYSPADYREMIEARALIIEGMLLRLERDGGRFRDPHDPVTAAAIAGVRRRGEEAGRAASAGDLNVLIGYDLRFWRELGTLFGNAYLSDFLNRLRVQSWVCAVQHLRRLSDLRGHLWSQHTELVNALVGQNLTVARELLGAYHSGSVALIERLAAKK